MAGGSGERFWPLSRKNRPKQLLRLTSGDKTMLHEAVRRIEPLIPVDRVYVVTGKHLVLPIRAARTGIPNENVIAEPCKRNTAGCLAFAAANILSEFGGDGSNVSMAVLTADHQIGSPERFRECVDIALDAAESQGVLATHGVVPTRAETGYGYIQREEGSAPLLETGDVEVFPVSAFHEKPARAKAEEFLADGSYYWNSGMFFWRLDSFLSEFARTQPEFAEAIPSMAGAIQKAQQPLLQNIFENLPSISIDNALMEHAENVAVVRAAYPWDDVGAWTSLDRTRERDSDGNVAHGDPVLINCKESIVYNDVGAADMAVGVVGMEGVVVVVSADGVLVIPKDRAQDVRDAVKALSDRGSPQV
jgi:mannose-1-phosphate guanylyltransferase